MGETEANATIATMKIQEAIPAHGEKWFTESQMHSTSYKNRGVQGPESTLEFRMDKPGYEKIRQGAIHQAGSKSQQPKQGTKFNIFNKERLRGHPKGKVNVGLKGADNVAEFNKSVINVRKIDPKSFWRKPGLRALGRNKLAVGLGALGVIIDAGAITIAVIEDGGEFGRTTQTTLAQIGGGFAGANLGALVGSLIPGLGNLIGAFIGGLIGSLVAGGITAFFLDVAPVCTPGPPLMDTDPFLQPQPSMGLQIGASGCPQLDVDTSMSGPSMGLETGAQGYPRAGFETRW